MNNVKKSIGWADWTINPVKGLCPVGCSYCYARRMYARNCNNVFKNKTIRYDPSVFIDLNKAKPGDRIFVGSTIDLFHSLCSAWNDEIKNICCRTPELTFIFLTKCYHNLPKTWSDNCWSGMSVTTRDQAYEAQKYFKDIKAKVKLINVEPLLECPDAWLLSQLIPQANWVICGSETPYSEKTAPRIEWVREIVDAADKMKIPVFLKDNLGWPKYTDAGSLPFYKKTAGTWRLRQELPSKEVSDG